MSLPTVESEVCLLNHSAMLRSNTNDDVSILNKVIDLSSKLIGFS